MRRISVAVLALAVTVPASGCGTADDRSAVRSATQAFYDAIRADDGAAACERLSEDTIAQLESQSGRACDEVVTRLRYEGGRIERVEVYVTNAKVDLSSAESAFLSEEAGEWKLSAIGCAPKDGKPRDRPLDCEVEA